jgi:pyruvate,orthophosphate dikinase
MAKKFVYFFGDGSSEGRADQKELLGGKGANLCEMANLGVPVPAGFTISTEVCTHYYEHGRKLPSDLDTQIRKAMARVERVMGGKFGDAKNPLLVSVRSGARVSMPGMMETVLNLGLNEKTLEGVIAHTKNPRFAWDSYRRFVQMFSAVVMELDSGLFNRRMDQLKHEVGVRYDTDLTADQLKQLTADYKAIYKREVGKPFPDDPWKQLEAAIGAVFQSWMKHKAVEYRRIYRIPGWWGTAVNVQSMVFGNMGDDCATGVAFTRDPGTGDDHFSGEFLVNAQGEDVVAGIRTPQPINKESAEASGSKLPTLEKQMPAAYKALHTIVKKLEKHYKDMQDIEFTIQNNKLWMLQTRNGKRTAQAAIRIAVDLVNEKILTAKEAVSRVNPEQLDELLHPIFEVKATKEFIASGLNASPGAAVGKAVFTAEAAVAAAKKHEKVILVRLETSPEDVAGMHAAQGILTARGGKTSHAAVVARGMGKTCVCGAEAISVDEHNNLFTVNTKAGKLTVKEGDFISLDGTKGEVYKGKVPVMDSEILQVLKGVRKAKDSDLYQYYEKFMSYAEGVRKLRVRTNADTPEDCRIARQFGAEGIGLTRTEHMFFDDARIPVVRQMIFAHDLEGRKKALKTIQEFQKRDFLGIFKEMAGLPVTIRLLDPPLHEFLPREGDKAAIDQLAKSLGISVKDVLTKQEQLHEVNPMLGHRGCRLGIVYPEITEAQVRAIIEAAIELKKKKITVLPEIMVPLIGTKAEFDNQADLIHKIAKDVIKEKKADLAYLVGTMIEVPRAALVADQVAETAQFFSFGTNDLTQMTFGYSRDDSNKFLPHYVEAKILPDDPFVSIDREGVGSLVRTAATLGRTTKPGLKLGICGEHGGDPKSVEFFHSVGLDYVSCSPYRVPIARLAAAQAATRDAQSKSAPAKKAAAQPSPKKAASKPAAQTVTSPAKKAPTKKSLVKSRK